MTTQALILILCFALSGLLTWTGVQRLRRASLLAGGMRLGAASMIGATGVALFGVTSNLYTYQRLTSETPVASLHFNKLAKQHYAVIYQPAGGEPHTFDLKGDEWQVDAKVLKWQGYATLMGFEPVFRLDRLASRYSDLQQARSMPPSVWPLAEESDGTSWISLWDLARDYETGLVDAIYGSSVFLPMKDDTRFSVSMSNSGLVAREVQ